MPGPTHVIHLATRFLGSLDPRPPSAADNAWVREHLSDGEFAVWGAMSNPDQRHSIQVARGVEAVVWARDGQTGDSDWPPAEVNGFESAGSRRAIMVAAALLHDSGKNVSGLNTWARVGATLLRPVVGRAVVEGWSAAGGVRRRLADYWRHPEIGGRVLEAAGSHPLVSNWAAEHHRPAASWSVDPALGRILRDCDND